MADPTLDLDSAETPADFGDDPGAVARRWISELELAEKEQEGWLKRGRRIIKRYREDRSETAVEGRSRRFSLLWANIQTLGPAVYARTPTAVVGRRWKDDDPVGRVASEVLERALNFAVDSLDFADVLLGLRDDFLLVGRGQAWVRYVPHMRTVTPPQPLPDPDGQLADDPEPYEVVDWEEAVVDHISWDDFLHNPARTWAEVRWVARTVYMTRDELVDRFGEEIGGEVPLDHGGEDHPGPDGEHQQWKKAAIHEIWDKPSRTAIWISKGWTEGALDQREDPLGLADFFPCPRPLLGTTAPDSLIPTPDYVYYEGQARDINDLTARIGLLTDAIRLRGFYAAGGETGKSLADLFASESGALIPVDSWAAFAERGGVKGLIEWIPLDMVMSALQGCIEARKQLIDDVYQVTGIADIMRGDTDPEETAAAQRIKADWGSSRVRDKQKELARFARDVLRIMGQVIAAKFSPETLAGMTNVQLLPTPEAKAALQAQLQAQGQQAQMLAARAQATGQPPPPPFQPPAAVQAMLDQPSWAEVMSLLRDNTLRAFRIDIETDSTIEPDDQDEKQRRIEFIQAVGEYIAKSMPALQLAPALTPVITEGLKFLVRGFRVGREMEEVIDKALDGLQAGGVQPQPGKAGKAPAPGRDPQAEQIKAQAAMTSAGAKAQDAGTRRFEAETDRFRAQAEAQVNGARVQAENFRTDADRSAEVAMHQDQLKADLQQAILTGVGRRFMRDTDPSQPIDPALASGGVIPGGAGLG
jgi:hypothetical protein